MFVHEIVVLLDVREAGGYLPDNLQISERLRVSFHDLRSILYLHDEFLETLSVESKFLPSVDSPPFGFRGVG